MNFQYLKDKYNIYPHILGYNYFNEPEPKGLSSYDVVFIESDIPMPLKSSIPLVFHTHAMKGDGMITWLNQDLSYINAFSPLPYRTLPTVGFVGRIPIFKGKGLHRGFENRYQACEILGQSLYVGTDFHVITEPIGESCSFYNSMSSEYKHKTKYLLESTMLSNHYNLCPRGNGNRSLRHFETLAYGRIPIYFNEGYVFPVINKDKFYYKLNKCSVYSPNVKNIEQDILAFHNIYDYDIELLQHMTRNLYDGYFTSQAQTDYCEQIIKERI